MHASDDLRTLRDWIRLYTPQLLGVARAFADGVDESEDLLQELWIVAHERMPDRPADVPIGAWLHTILLNIGRTRWRRRRRRERLMSWWGASAAPVAPAVDFDGSILRGALWRDVAALPELQRQVLLLRIVDDLSTTQTAQTLNRAEGTVKASLHRALETLRGKLKQRSNDDA